jgi:hypothetical protein
VLLFPLPPPLLLLFADTVTVVCAMSAWTGPSMQVIV